MNEQPHLLPDNAPAFLRDLSSISAQLEQIDPSAIETIWDAWRCPAVLLPWLAWAVSIDVWDDTWAETIKRQAVADSPYYHRIKGSVRAVEAALALAQRPFDLTEWFDAIPVARRGTARIHVETTLDDVPRVLRAIRPLVLAAKPKTRAVAFGAGEMMPGSIAVGAGLLEEILTTIDPYAYGGEELDAGFVVGAGLLIESLTIIEALP